MAFKENIIELINKLEIENTKAKDIALNKVIEILKTIDNLSDLKKEKGLIVRIVIDSVENMETGNTVLTFINNYTKK